MAERDGGDPNTPVTVVIGIVGAILTFVVIIALQAVFFQVERAELRRKSDEAQPEDLARFRAEQAELLHGYRWVDQSAGVVAIPIGRAMELVVRELAAEGQP